MADDDAHGPIDYVVIEFPDQKPTGEAAAEMVRLVDSGVIALYDILVLRKAADGSHEELDIATLTDSDNAAIKSLAGARSGLLGADDAAAAAGIMEPGTLGVILLYENSWARPFVSAARQHGANLIASQRLSAQEIMDTLDAADAAS